MSKNKTCFDKKLMEQIEDYHIKDVLVFLDTLHKTSQKITEEKDKDYGGSWQKDGLLSVHLNTKRKWDRLQNIFENGFEMNLESETVIDTLIDLRNYVSLYAFFINKKYPEQFLKFIKENTDVEK